MLLGGGDIFCSKGDKRITYGLPISMTSSGHLLKPTNRRSDC